MLSSHLVQTVWVHTCSERHALCSIHFLTSFSFSFSFSVPGSPVRFSGGALRLPAGTREGNIDKPLGRPGSGRAGRYRSDSILVTLTLHDPRAPAQRYLGLNVKRALF